MGDEAAVDDSLDLTSDYGVAEGDDDDREAPEEDTPSWSRAEPADSDDDMLELGDADVAGEVDPEVVAEWPPKIDVTPPPAHSAPRISTGGTLFERMSNLSRGLSRSDDEDEAKDKDDSASGGLNIPRFLDRQSNN